MSTTEAENVEWPLGDLETVIADMRASIGILGHLIRANSARDNEVNDDAFHKVEDDLIAYGKQIEELWRRAWDQHKSEIAALKAEHAAALAAVRAEKAAPGSVEMVSKAEDLWTMLRSIAQVTSEYCVEAGYPPRRLSRRRLS